LLRINLTTAEEQLAGLIGELRRVLRRAEERQEAGGLFDP
jgi:hypothetical protein